MNKAFTIFCAAVCFLAGATLSAQVRNGSSSTKAGGYPGTLTWSYKSVDGREVLEGKKSFTARSGEDTYTLEANYKDGVLDGAASVKLHKGYMATGREGGSTQVWRASLDVTLSARFQEGRLTGMLTCNYTPSGSTRAGLQDMNKQSFSASYVDGAVNGNYSYINYGYAPRVGVSGSTDSDGFADGIWQEYQPQTATLTSATYKNGAPSTSSSSAVRSFLSGTLSEKKLFDDYGYLPVVEERTFRGPSEFFGYVLEVWLKDYNKVIPFDFGNQNLHKVKMLEYAIPETFTPAGFDRFKEMYYDSVSGGAPMEGVTVALEGNTPGVVFSPEVFLSWKPYVRNLAADPLFVALSPAQASSLQDAEVLDKVRRGRAHTAADLLPDSPYKDMMALRQLPSERIATARGCEEIAEVSAGAAAYAASVRKSIASLPKTPDGKFFIKDGQYYANPGWDFNLISADSERIVTACKDAAKLYDKCYEYASSRADLGLSFRKLCEPVVKGSYAEMLGGVANAQAFEETIITPDLLAKVGSREEMQSALGDQAYAQLLSVWPEAPAASFSDVKGMQAFADKTREYAAYQRSLIDYDRLVKEILSEKASLDEGLSSSRAYRQAAAQINERLSAYTLRPAFTDVAGYTPVKARLEECLVVVKDARDYVTVHREYLAESEALRDKLSRVGASRISKFYKSLAKGFSLDWDNALPLGQCSGSVRQALGVTRRVADIAARPDVDARDKAIKGLSSTEEIWRALEQ